MAIGFSISLRTVNYSLDNSLFPEGGCAGWVMGAALGYCSYYGPKTVTGTFGTAILSRYPLWNTHSIFSYSDMDETGTASAEIEAGGEVFRSLTSIPMERTFPRWFWQKHCLNNPPARRM